MAVKKYRLKDGLGSISLTSPAFECIIRKDDEVELTEQQLIRVGKFVEEVKPRRTRKKKEVEEAVVEEIQEEERVTDIFVEDDE